MILDALFNSICSSLATTTIANEPADWEIVFVVVLVVD